MLVGGVNVDVDGAEDENKGEGGGAGVTNSLPTPLPLPTLRPRSSVLEKRLGIEGIMPPPLAAAAPFTPFTMGAAAVAVAEVEAEVPNMELPL